MPQVTKILSRTKPRRKYRKAVLSKAQRFEVSKIASRQISRRSENKAYDRTYNSSVGWGGQILDLSAVTQGDTSSTRDGDSLYVRGVSVRGNIVPADATNTVRALVFQWSPNSSDDSPSIDEVLEITSSANDVHAYYHKGDSQKYTILWDKTYALSSTSNDNQVFNTGWLRPKVKKLQFSAGVSSGTNHIYFLILSDSGVAAHPAFVMNTRLTFNDM